jgi:hypothetical protein
VYMDIDAVELSTRRDVYVTDGQFTIDISEIENPGEILSIKIGHPCFKGHDPFLGAS